MSAFKTYKGGRLDLEHYRGKSIDGYAIDVFNDDDTDFDLDVYDDIFIRIFEKIHGTLVLTFNFETGISTDSPAGNTIYWNATKSQMDIRPKLYWHECYGVINVNPTKEELIFQGVSEVI